MKCNICYKVIKENTEGNDKYCQGHDIFIVRQERKNDELEYKNMPYVTRDREAGNEIERFRTFDEAITAIEEYEEEDRKNGEYTDDFYEVSAVHERVSIKFTRYCEGCGEETWSFEDGVYGWEDGLCDVCWDKKNGLCVECEKPATLGDFCKECSKNIPL